MSPIPSRKVTEFAFADRVRRSTLVMDWVFRRQERPSTLRASVFFAWLAESLLRGSRASASRPPTLVLPPPPPPPRPPLVLIPKMVASRVILPDRSRPLSHMEISMRILRPFSVLSILAVVFFARPLASAPPEAPLYQRFMSPASPQEVVAARKDRSGRLGGLCRRQAERLHRGGAAVRARAANELSEGRWHYDVRDSHLGRRQHGRVHARRGAESRGLVAQRHRRPQRAGTRGLGGAHERHRRRVAGRRRLRTPNWRRMAARFCSSKPDRFFARKSRR